MDTICIYNLLKFAEGRKNNVKLILLATTLFIKYSKKKHNQTNNLQFRVVGRKKAGSFQTGPTNSPTLNGASDLKSSSFISPTYNFNLTLTCFPTQWMERQVRLDRSLRNTHMAVISTPSLA